MEAKMKINGCTKRVSSKKISALEFKSYEIEKLVGKYRPLFGPRDFGFLLFIVFFILFWLFPLIHFLAIWEELGFFLFFYFFIWGSREQHPQVSKLHGMCGKTHYHLAMVVIEIETFFMNREQWNWWRMLREWERKKKVFSVGSFWENVKKGKLNK